jgi:hypothetical protein
VTHPLLYQLPFPADRADPHMLRDMLTDIAHQIDQERQFGQVHGHVEDRLDRLEAIVLLMCSLIRDDAARTR